MLKITVDTREQQPWAFPDHLAAVNRGTLRAGDYALDGDYGFAVERKSLNDFVGTLSSGWDRFLKQLMRMASHATKVIIVEGSLVEVIKHEYNHPKVKPVFILKRIAELTMLGVSVLFADNPITAAGLCFSILKRRAEEIGN